MQEIKPTEKQLAEIKDYPYGNFKEGAHITAQDFKYCNAGAITGVVDRLVVREGTYYYKIVGIEHTHYPEEEVLGETFYVPVVMSTDWEGRVFEVDYDLSEVESGYEEYYLESRGEGESHEEAVEAAQDAYETSDQEGPDEPHVDQGYIDFIERGGIR